MVAQDGEASAAEQSSAGSTSTLPRSSLPVTLEGARDACLHYDESLFWLDKSRGAERASSSDPGSAFVCVPVDLVLDASFVPDSDGGSLYVRLLAPPSEEQSSFFSLSKPKPRAKLVVETERGFGSASRGSLTPKERAECLRVQLEGPCQKLRLLKVEARTNNSKEAEQWVKGLLRGAYLDVKPYRRLKVLVNPAGGPGKARQLFQTRVRPILEAAGCCLDVQVTERVRHGTEIAQKLPLDQFDALLFISGDGLAHEILNGFAQRPDAAIALKMPMCPIPAGSGNALCVNLLGPQQGFNLALATLNAIKGQPLPLDICVVTQPRSAASDKGKDKSRRPNSTAEPSVMADAADQDPVALAAAPALPFVQYYSFLSQAIGLMADVDLGTEHMRALGDSRFIIGYLSGVIAHNECLVDIDVKLGDKGSKDKSKMREKTSAFNSSGQWKINGDSDASASTGMPDLRHGAVTEPLYGDDGSPSVMSAVDPSWTHNILNDNKAAAQPEQDPPLTSWARLKAPVSTLYAGKIPYVARDLMQFPYALPGDGTVDVALQLHGGGRASKLRAISDAESGAVVYDRAVVYLKVEAYRVTPRLPAGDPRLKKGGLVSIDGEHRPYAPFQVEVSSLQAMTMSLFGRFNVPEVPQPPEPRA